MPRAIVHRTRGLLDLRAISVMGLSAKPGTKNPIGMFGTGLKYAIATICRKGGAPVLWIGRTRYAFSARAADFRGANYQQLRMRVEKPGLIKPSYKALPFTTEYGKFWETWMAFRELESNTRDESGETFLLEEGESIEGREGETLIVVDLPEYVHAWTFRDEVFLPNGARAPISGGPIVQAFADGPRDKLYWRGMRVKDLAKKTVRTWNLIGDQTLTEDRTLLSEWSARYDLAVFISRDCDDADLIRDVICADDKHWEHRLDWPSHVTPSDLFKRVSFENRRSSFGVWGYVSGHMPRRAPPPVDVWTRAARPWAIESDADDPRQIVDANGNALFARPDGFDADEWLELAEGLIRRINPPKPVEAAAAADFIAADAATAESELDDQIPF